MIMGDGAQQRGGDSENPTDLFVDSHRSPQRHSGRRESFFFPSIPHLRHRVKVRPADLVKVPRSVTELGGGHKVTSLCLLLFTKLSSTSCSCQRVWCPLPSPTAIARPACPSLLLTESRVALSKARLLFPQGQTVHQLKPRAWRRE